MRKKTIKNICSTVFWYVLYLLPVISYLLYLFGRNGADPSLFSAFLGNFVVLENNIVYSTLSSIFGANGILPFTNSNALFIILTWYVFVYIAHLLIDFLLFIPSYAHKLIKEFTDYD